MDIYSYISTIPNLGDDLNHWLWNKVLPPSFLDKEGTFIGIGSVIHPEHLSRIQNPGTIHILGAGSRNKEYPLTGVNQEMKIHAVRGPLSAKALRLPDEYSLIDAAYAIRFTPMYKDLLQLPKKYKHTLITYFRSKDLIYYPLLQKLKNVHILHSSDYGSIENALKIIAQSEYVISESLHGAILADALRVPWTRLNFYLKNSRDKETAEFKWADWVSSINLNNIPTLEVPLLLPNWISPRRNALLRPVRTVDYIREFQLELRYSISAEKLLNEKTRQLRSCINNLDT